MMIESSTETSFLMLYIKDGIDVDLLFMIKRSDLGLS